MHEDKHCAALREVSTTIRTALDDSAGLLEYQRRLMSMLSLGVQHLIELYLHRKAAIQPGAQIKHEWFKLSDARLWERLQPALTLSAPDIPLLNELCFLARTVEENRNDIVYGAPLRDDAPLRKCIDAFLGIKRRVESETGPIS